MMIYSHTNIIIIIIIIIIILIIIIIKAASSDKQALTVHAHVSDSAGRG